MKLDRNLLVSLLGQLGKENDNEVLVAARKITALLRDNHIHWQDLVSGGGGDFQPQTKMKLLKLDANRNFMKAADDLPQFLELRASFFNQEMSALHLAKLDYFYELYIGERDLTKKDPF